MAVETSEIPSASLLPGVQDGVVLVIDDDAATRTLVARWLGSSGLEVVLAGSGDEALAYALGTPARIDAIVLDVMMPGLDGFEVLARLRADPRTAAIPVVMLTAHANDEEDVLRCLRGGAVDHISKPFRGSVLAAKVSAVCERRRAQRLLEAQLERAERIATTDALTGLWNRRHFEARLGAEAAHAKRHRTPFALLLVDLDYFKTINDLFGHAEGDRVLQTVARALGGVLRPDDAAFRVGGEEFAVLLRTCDAEGAKKVGERLRAALEAGPVELGGEPRVITFSGGVAAADASNEFATDSLVVDADHALYRAKRAGRDRIELAR